jgi:hypothetical protein
LLLLGFTTVAVSGCLDWDALRGPSTDAAAGVADSGTTLDPDGPRAAWYFSGTQTLTGKPGEVRDDAPASPDVPLSAVPGDTDPPEGNASIENGTLVLENRSLRAEPQAYAALVQTITAAADNLSIEFWIDGSNLQEPGTFFSLGGDTLVMQQSRLGITVLFETTGGRSDLQSAPGTGVGLHHLVVTWRPNDGVAILYVDGQLAALDTIMAASGAWPATGGTLVLGSIGFTGKVLSAAVFDRALDAATISRRFSAGPR